MQLILSIFVSGCRSGFSNGWNGEVIAGSIKLRKDFITKTRYQTEEKVAPFVKWVTNVYMYVHISSGCNIKHLYQVVTRLRLNASK